MNNFFVPQKVYEDRIAICKSCIYYFKPTGNCKICLCFMKVKSRISSQSCPKGFWQKTTEVEVMTDIPEEIIAEVLDLWKDLKTGRAKNQTAKKKMIEIYNVLYNTNYSVGTNCGSCISTCFDGIKKIYKQYSKNEY
jgi:hypothetical protein